MLTPSDSNYDDAAKVRRVFYGATKEVWYSTVQESSGSK